MSDIERLIIQFDSCTSMLKSLSRFLHGKDFAGLGIVKPKPAYYGDLLNALPGPVRSSLYRWSGWFDALPPGRLAEIKGEDISEWAGSFYPERKFDGVMIGSSNGAAVHLGAALGIPWLPQTFLAAARRNRDPDEPVKDVEWGRKAIKPFLEANPDWEVHQMSDPLQDRLMITKMGYFRLKRAKLGKSYEKFILNRVNPGARILTVECRNDWPKLKVQDRHTFQIGGFGGITSEEYLGGGEKVEKFLKKAGSKVKHWDTFEPDGYYPEAEWGFVDGLLEDSRAFAKKNGYRLERLVFKEPECLSPFIADLYRWWYAKLGIPANRLLMENFALHEPYWTLKTGSIPLWLAFNTSPSTTMAKDYVEKTGPFDEIWVMLMSNGVPHGIGLTHISDWRKIISGARVKGDFLGVHEKKYPLDFGNFLKFHDDLKKKITARYEFPEPLTWDDVEEFYSGSKGRYPVEWIKE